MHPDPRRRAAEFAALAEDDAERWWRDRAPLPIGRRLEEALALAACLLADAARRGPGSAEAIDRPLPPALRSLLR